MKLQQIVSMESPIETLEQHADHAHSDATSHEKPVLPEWRQNLDPLLKIAAGDWLEDSRFQISAAISLCSEIFFCSAYWWKNEFCWAQEEPRAREVPGTYSTRPSSTTSDILTPGLQFVSLRGVPP